DAAERDGSARRGDDHQRGATRTGRAVGETRRRAIERGEVLIFCTTHVAVPPGSSRWRHPLPRTLMTARLGLLLLFLTLGVFAALPVTAASAGDVGDADAVMPERGAVAEPVALDPAGALYTDAALDGILARDAFDAAYASVAARGFDVNSGTLAI